MIKCENCKGCRFICSNNLCEISENQDDCPLANLSEFNNCVIGLTFDKIPILSYKKMVLNLAMKMELCIIDAEELIDYNYIRGLDGYKTKPIIMYEI